MNKILKGLNEVVENMPMRVTTFNLEKETKMTEWTTPVITEQPVGLEVTSYSPAEL